jgi:hypothetical protein
MTDPSDLVERLAQHRTLGGVPRTELEWLVAHGELVRMEPGELLTKVPRMVESLSILLSGHFAIYVDHGAGPHKVMEWAGGDVSGFLPYSRMGKPPGETVIDEAGDVVLVNVRHFPEMIRECSAVTTRLVHVMLDRARQFRSSELQDEKMLSLGKLSAGLAHELNNPASAAARSARLLNEALDEGEAAAQALGAARLDAAQLAAVANARVACAAAAPAALAPLARADREDSIADWLVEHGADANAAAPLADTGVTIQSLDALAAKLDRALGDGAALAGEQVAHRAQRGRLAGAVAAEQRQDSALGHAQRHALQHEDHVVVDDLDAVDVEKDVGCGAHGAVSAG